MQDKIVSFAWAIHQFCVNGSADIMVSRYVAPFHIIVGGISCCSTLRERCGETTMDVVWIRWLVDACTIQ